MLLMSRPKRAPPGAAMTDVGERRVNSLISSFTYFRRCDAWCARIEMLLRPLLHMAESRGGGRGWRTTRPRARSATPCG